MAAPLTEPPTSNVLEAKPDLTVAGVAAASARAKTLSESHNLIEFIQNRIFVLWYRNRFRPASSNIMANTLEEAREKGQDYCERFNLRFISVHPFFLDLNKKPAADITTIE